MKKYNIYVSTDPGKVREINEDSFVVNRTTKNTDESTQHIKANKLSEPLLCGVFDGMGGEKGGFEASDRAAIIAAEYYKYLIKYNGPINESISGYVSSCGNLIKEYLAENKLNRGGTTFAMAFMKDDISYLFTMGDTRIYLLRGGMLMRVSRDHTLAQKKYEANIFTKEEAEKSHESHMLTRFLGMDPDSADCVAESYAPIALSGTDKLLICSDGLYDMCSDAEIADVLLSNESDYSIKLVIAARKNGGVDNITCIVVEPAE